MSVDRARKMFLLFTCWSKIISNLKHFLNSAVTVQIIIDYIVHLSFFQSFYLILWI